MSTQDMRKLASVIRSIELIEEKTNILHSQYTTGTNENDKRQKAPIDDSSLPLQLFFQHLEQLLQTDLKTGLFSLNNQNKRNYWNFFTLALKESKGLYDTVSYVLNSQEVKTPIGRGRLFLRFCLQNHRLGDVIQQSFMMTKIVNQFYADDCFWTTPTYMNRIIQALYQLNDLKFDLLSAQQYQLDVSWPAIEPVEPRAKEISQDPSRIRNESTSSLISMNSVDSQSIVSMAQDPSDSTAVISIQVPEFESSFNGAESPSPAASVEDDPENTVVFWKEKYLQFELQLQEIQSAQTKVSTDDAEIQCILVDPIDQQSLIDENDKIKKEMELLNERTEQLQNEGEELTKNNEQLTDETCALNEKNEQLNTQLTVLQEEMNNLNFQLSSIAMQRSTTSDKIKEYEREIGQYQNNLAAKETSINKLQEKYNQQSEELKSIEGKYLENFNQQKQRIESLEIEVENANKLLEDERKSLTKERQELGKSNERLEAALQEKTLDFEEMKRRLIKAVREKAELFNSIHSYEMKLEQEQSKKWVADEDVDNCTKCNVAFGWTVRRHHCRHCQKIFCNHCSNNWIQSTKTNTPQYRICDFCNEKGLKEPTPPSNNNNTNAVQSVFYLNREAEAGDDDNNNNNNNNDDVDLRFEVRPERLSASTDSQSKA